MTEREDLRNATAQVLDNTDVEGVLSGSYYDPNAAPKRLRPVDSQRPAKPDHYKVICISMYMDDLKRLDDMVDELKIRGLTKANRSALIRYALSNVELDNVPKGL